MSPAEAFSILPDDALLPMHIIRQHYILRQDACNRDITTVEASAELGHSSNWWQDQARQGLICGAYQASPKSPWYFPRQQAIIFLREYKEQRQRRKRRGSRWQAAQESG